MYLRTKEREMMPFMDVDASNLKNELCDMVARRALQPFADRNISMDDVQEGIDNAAKLVIITMDDSFLAVVTADEEPRVHGLDVPGDPGFGHDDQLKYWGHTWDDTKGLPLHNRILAWYAIRSGASNRIREIRGNVPWSWEDVLW